MTSIGSYAFEYCTNLKTVTIPASIKTIEERAFLGCSSLTEMTIPGSTSIGFFVFQDCSNLAEITISEGVTSIGNCAFAGCSSLTNVTIPTNVTSIADGAFSGCGSLTIYGKTGSAAQTHANNNNIPFIASSASELKDISRCTVGAIGAQAYTGKAITPDVTVKDGAAVLKKDMDYTVSYKNNTYPGTATATITGKGNYTGTTTKTFTIKAPSVAAPKSVSVRLAKGDYDAVYASWSKVAVTGATVKYKVQYKVGSGSWKTAAKGTTKTSHTVKALSDGKKVTVKVTPYVVVNKKTYNGSTKTSAGVYTLKKLNKPSVKKAGKTKVKVSWNNINGESGYEIYKSAKKTKGFKLAKRVTSATAKSTTFKAAKKKTYYYKVRAYKTIKISGKTYRVYGPWSAVKSYKLK